MIGTLENMRLREGNRVIVSLGSGIYQAEIVDSSDQSKIKVRLETGSELWAGRRVILSLANDD